MGPNFLILLAAALIPMVMGFIWYNPKTLGNAWMKAADVTEEKMKGANMALIFGLSFVFSIMLSTAVYLYCSSSSTFVFGFNERTWYARTNR
jgi:UDP-N-acetylmuramyl pentapeptide phosphotransferase/UDP-N-acetylglucosamine-1-phosphate transferase